MSDTRTPQDVRRYYLLVPIDPSRQPTWSIEISPEADCQALYEAVAKHLDVEVGRYVLGLVSFDMPLLHLCLILDCAFS